MFAYRQYKLRKSKYDPVCEYSKFNFGVFYVIGTWPCDCLL